MFDEKALQRKIIREVKSEISQFEAMKILARNDDLAIHIESCGLNLGLCDGKKIIAFLNNEIKERKKFIDGKPNKWE